MQQDNFDLETESGSFPPLSDNPSNNHAPSPTLQPPNLSEEGASNLADIVKGKRQKEGTGGPGLMNGNAMPPLPNGLSDRLSNKMVAPAKTVGAGHQHGSSPQSPRVQQKVEPKVKRVGVVRHTHTRAQFTNIRTHVHEYKCFLCLMGEIVATVKMDMVSLCMYVHTYTQLLMLV